MEEGPSGPGCMPPGWSVKTSLRRLKEWQDLAYGLDQRERGLKPEKYTGKDPAKKKKKKA